MNFTESVTALLLGIETHLSKHEFSALKQICLVVDQVKAMQEGQQVLQAWTQVCQLQNVYYTPCLSKGQIRIIKVIIKIVNTILFISVLV